MMDDYYILSVLFVLFTFFLEYTLYYFYQKNETVKEKQYSDILVSLFDSTSICGLHQSILDLSFLIYRL